MADIQEPSTTANALGITLAPTVDHEAGFEPCQVAAPYASAISHFNARYSHMAIIGKNTLVWLYNTPHHLMPALAGRVLVPRR